MAELSIEIAGVDVEPFAAAPTLRWSLSIGERTGIRVHALALHAQLRIEPRRRHYDAAEQDRLLALFGPPRQWGETLNPFVWAHLDTVVPGFSKERVVEVPMACTYDFEVTASKYLHALDGGKVPLTFLFSGSVFSVEEDHFVAEPVPWHIDAEYQMPVSVWRDVMDAHFPGTGWLRLERSSIERLERYRAEQALPTWEQAIDSLFKAAGEEG